MKGRRALTPRIPTYSFDVEVEDAQDVEAAQSEMLEEVKAPAPPPRGGGQKWMVQRELRDVIAKEASVFELRAARLRSVEAANARLARNAATEAQRERCHDEFTLTKEWHDKAHVVPAPPDAKLRPSTQTLQGVDVRHEYEKIFSHQLAAVQQRSVNRVPSVIPVPPLPSTPSSRSSSESPLSVASADPLEGDAVWRVLQADLHPDEVPYARDRRMREIASARREEHRIYSLRAKAELAAEEAVAAGSDMMRAHRATVSAAMAQEVREADAAAEAQRRQEEEEAAGSAAHPLQLDALLSRQLGLVRRVRRQPTFAKAELEVQRRNWLGLTRQAGGGQAGAARRGSDGGAEARRWIGVWRHETHVHHEAATRLQCAWRQVLARRRVNRVALLRSVHMRGHLESEDRRESEYTQWMAELWHQQHNQAEQEDKRAREVVSNFLLGCVARRRAVRMRAERDAAGKASRRNHAAVRIQALYRGMHARRRAYLARNPLEVPLWLHAFQGRYRGVLRRVAQGCVVRQRLARVGRCVVAIQAQIRGYLARKERRCLQGTAVRRVRRSRRHHAAFVIQRNARRVFRLAPGCGVPGTPASSSAASAPSTACLVPDPYDTEEAHSAATKIQSLARRRQARREMVRRRDEREYMARRRSSLRKGELEYAASVLQGAFRMPAARRELQARREARASSDEFHAMHMRQREESNAAQAIQRCWRRLAATRETRAALRRRQEDHTTCIQDDAVCTIQSAWKGRGTRSALEQQSYGHTHLCAHAVLRRFYTTHVSCAACARRLQDLQETDARRQHRAQGNLHMVRHEAALVLQCWWRCCQARGLLCRRATGTTRCTDARVSEELLTQDP